MRPIVIALVGYIIGIIWGLYFNISIVPFLILIWLIFKGISIFKIKKRKWIRYKNVFLSKKILWILFSGCVISNTIVLFQNYQYQNLYKNIEEAEFVAIVIREETRKEYHSVYQIKVESINQQSKYAGTHLLLQMKEEGVLAYGDKIVFTGEYKKPQGARNKNGFDYASYLKTIGVYGTVKTSKSAVKVEQKQQRNPIFLLANQTKHRIKKQCNKSLPEDSAKLLQGILLGETDSLDEETITDFRNSSLYHMLAVSGAHISYLILGCQLLFHRLATRKKNLLTILVLFFFLFVTDFSLSVVRACTMGMLVLLAEVLYQKSDFLNNISIALFLILLQNPYAIQSLSVLLSFGGTIGVVYLSKDMKARKRKEAMMVKPNKIKAYLKENLLITLSAQLMVAPILLIHFHTISLTFLLSNSVAAILIGPIILLRIFSYFPLHSICKNSKLGRTCFKSIVISSKTSCKADS